MDRVEITKALWDCDVALSEMDEALLLNDPVRHLRARVELRRLIVWISDNASMEDGVDETEAKS